MPLASNDLVGFGHGPGPIIVGSTTTNNTAAEVSTSTFTMTTPTGTQPGDLLIMSYGAGGANGQNISAVPSGWIEIRDNYNSASGVVQAISYGYAGATVPSSYSFTSSSNYYWGACLLAIRNGVYRQSAFTTTANSVTPSPAVSLSGVTAGSLLLWVASSYYDMAPYTLTSSGWTVLENKTADSYYHGTSVAKKENSPGGATGNVQFTCSGGAFATDVALIEIGAM